ncbi:MAG TPA: disulfide bond formation protein DsbA [Opitutaceae bacterium]|nr:disulfide bond formation protein DsbA [Opitutaceae bacterium]
MAAVKVVYFTEVFSSWCYWGEPMWAELKARYSGRVDFEVRIAMMRPEDFPGSREQCDWAYRRSGGTVMRSPFMLSSGWVEPGRQGGYPAGDLVLQAAVGLGADPDKARLALMEAALRQGRKIGQIDEAVAAAARATGLDPKALKAGAESPGIRAEVDASSAEYFAHQLGQNQRPAFLLTDATGSKAVLAGLVQIAPLAAAIDAMLSDCAAYAAHAAHHPPPGK